MSMSPEVQAAIYGQAEDLPRLGGLPGTGLEARRPVVRIQVRQISHLQRGCRRGVLRPQVVGQRLGPAGPGADVRRSAAPVRRAAGTGRGRQLLIIQALGRLVWAVPPVLAARWQLYRANVRAEYRRRRKEANIDVPL